MERQSLNLYSVCCASKFIQDRRMILRKNWITIQFYLNITQWFWYRWGSFLKRGETENFYSDRIPRLPRIIRLSSINKVLIASLWELTMTMMTHDNGNTALHYPLLLLPVSMKTIRFDEPSIESTANILPIFTMQWTSSRIHAQNALALGKRRPSSLGPATWKKNKSQCSDFIPAFILYYLTFA